MEQLRNDVVSEQVCHYGKQKGQKSEVYALDVENVKKLTNYFIEKEMWLHYMLFIVSCNIARRISDTLSLRWEHVFDTKTGNFRKDSSEFEEKKTGKLANPRINSACRSAINLYIEKTGCDVSKDNYTVPMFMQLTGTHKGRILSDSGYLKALKKASAAVGIEDNVGTHSARKTFGMMSRMIHPGDYDSMELLQTIYNHSSTGMTKKYIGLTKQKIDAYYDDMGVFFEDYIIGDKEFKEISGKPIVNLDANDLRDIVRAAYEAGKNNADNGDTMVHVDAINNIMAMIEKLQK